MDLMLYGRVINMKALDELVIAEKKIAENFSIEGMIPYTLIDMRHVWWWIEHDCVNWSDKEDEANPEEGATYVEELNNRRSCEYKNPVMVSKDGAYTGTCMDGDGHFAFYILDNSKKKMVDES